jgi:hypothetical protein
LAAGGCVQGKKNHHEAGLKIALEARKKTEKNRRKKRKN